MLVFRVVVVAITVVVEAIDVSITVAVNDNVLFAIIISDKFIRFIHSLTAETVNSKYSRYNNY